MSDDKDYLAQYHKQQAECRRTRAIIAIAIALVMVSIAMTLGIAEKILRFMTTN